MAIKKTEKKAAGKPAVKTATAKKPVQPKAKKEVVSLPEMKGFPTVRKGSKETGYITLLQTNLKNRGFYEGPVDGKFGEKTEQAVMDFQKTCGKPMNGIVGPKTWEMLQNSNVVKIAPSVPVFQSEEENRPIRIPQESVPGVRVLIEGLTKYQADLLLKLLQGHTECRIL